MDNNKELKPASPTRQLGGESSTDAKPHNQESRHFEQNGWIEKHKVTIITILSLLAGLIITLIIVLLVVPREPLYTNDPTSSGSNTKKDTEVTTYLENDEIQNLRSAEDTSEVASEYSEKYLEVLNEPSSMASEKYSSAMQLSRIYINSDNTAEAIPMLIRTLDTPNLTSVQRVELLFQLSNCYAHTNSTSSRIAALKQILEVPSDDSYTPEQKAYFDNNISGILKEQENE